MAGIDRASRARPSACSSLVTNAKPQNQHLASSRLDDFSSARIESEPSSNPHFGCTAMTYPPGGRFQQEVVLCFPVRSEKGRSQRLKNLQRSIRCFAFISQWLPEIASSLRLSRKIARQLAAISSPFPKRTVCIPVGKCQHQALARETR
jgi:hypothetical protein